MFADLFIGVDVSALERISYIILIFCISITQHYSIDLKQRPAVENVAINQALN